MKAEDYPDFWKLKWLVPIPKVDMNVGRGDLRPLMLIEVLRKLWYGFTVETMWDFLEDNKLLESNQFAYRRGKEGPHCFLQMVNMIEEMQESGASFAMSTYDLIHAFDEISYNANKISNIRCGMTIENTNKLIDIEAESKVYVRTPLAHEHWAKKIANKLRDRSYTLRLSNEDPCPFTPEGGVPQGDKMSCIYWTQFEDIVLAALRLDNNKYKIYIRGSDGEIHAAQDICYADDLTTFSTTIEG